MDAVIVSDVHCDGPASPTQAAFLRFLATRPAETVVLGGDVFHAFAAPRRRPFSAYAPVIEALSTFSVVVVPGNHDWLLPAFLAEHSARVPVGPHGAIGARVELTLGGLRARVAHGDEVDPNPRYRAFHAGLRSRAFASALDALGETGAWKLMHRLAGPLGDGHSDPKLVSAQRGLAGGWISDGVELVVLGHTHVPSCERMGAGTFLNPGDWVRHRTYGVVHGREVELRRFEG